MPLAVRTITSVSRPPCGHFALLELGRHEQAETAFCTVADLAGRVDPAPSRAEASFMLFEGVAVGPRDLAAEAFHWLLTTVQPSRHWRARRAVREAVIEAVTVGLVGPSDVPGLLTADLSVQALRRIGKGDRRQPRPFFWSRGQADSTTAHARDRAGG